MPLASSKESLDTYKRDRTGQMRIDGGLAVPFEKVKFKPAPSPLTPQILRLSLTQLNKRFIEILVQPDQKVKTGDTLARAEKIELLAPASGQITQIESSKRKTKGFIELRIDSDASSPHNPPSKTAPVPQMREFVQKQGIWIEIQSGMDMAPPPLDDEPKAIIVRCIFAEPHVVPGALIIQDHLDDFINGLEILNRLAGGYAPLEMTFPEQIGQFGRSIREQLRGRAFIHTVSVPIRYPVENPLLLATLLGQSHGWGPDHFWILEPQTVIALARAFADGRPWTTRLIGVSGPAVKQPTLIEAPLGTPLKNLVADNLRDTLTPDRCCFIRGGLYSGPKADPDDGLELLDRNLVVIPAEEKPEMFGWIRPGFDRHSWTRFVGSALKPPSAFVPRALLRGDLRPCVHCGFCHEACPVGLYPHQLHRLITHDIMDEAEQLGLLNCVECHSCSYGCVSKIELSTRIIAARRELLSEGDQ